MRLLINSVNRKVPFKLETVLNTHTDFEFKLMSLISR